MTVKTQIEESTSTIIPTRPGIQISNCKKGGVGKTLLSKLTSVRVKLKPFFLP